MDENAPKRRRWFAFSLRTLFALTTVAAIAIAWTNYQLEWIRQRQGMAVFLRSDRCVVGRLGSTDAPAQLRILGEKGIALIWTRYAEDSSQFRAVKFMFPEATVLGASTTTLSDDRRYLLLR